MAVYTIGKEVAFTSALLAIATVTSLLRFYVRVGIVKSFGLDDWFALVGYLLYLPLTIVYLYVLRDLAFGRPSQDLAVIEATVRWIWFIQMLYFICSPLVKVSFALLFLRLVRKSIHVYILKAMIVLIVLGNIAGFLLFLLQCRPIPYTWQRVHDPYNLVLLTGGDPVKEGLKPRGYCASARLQLNANYSQIAINLVADLVLGLAIPIVLLRSLTMRRSLKITTGVLLGFGALPSVCTIMRLPYARELLSNNVLVDVLPLFFWTAAELATCVIGISIATLKPLTVKMKLLSKASDPQYTMSELNRAKGTDDKASSSQFQRMESDIEKGGSKFSDEA